MITAGIDYESSLKCIEFTNKYEEIYACVGLYPENACKDNNYLSWLKELIKDKKVIAIGEIGLDYYWDRSFIDKQKEVFINQIEFAKEHFPGHKIIVCTHTDGHNGSNNIHCHIVVHSVRFCDVEKKSYMTKSCEWREGKKHWASKSFLEHIKKSVMELCEREGFEQVDL